MIKFKDKIINFILYCIAILLVIDINCVWVREYKLGDDFFTILCCGFIIIYLFISNFKIKFNDIIIFIYIFILVTYSVVFKSAGYMYFITVGLGFPLVIIFMKNIKMSECDIVGKISDVIFVFSVVALFFYIFGTVLDLLPGAEYTAFYWGGDRYVKSYYNIYFESQGSGQFFNNKVISRNCGFFCEAPMFGYLIAVSFIIELFIKKSQNYFKIVVLLITGLTTTSSTSIVVLFVALILFAVHKAFESGNNKLLKMLLIVGIPGIVACIVYICYWFFNAKKLYGTVSYNLRTDDIVSCFKAFLSSPVFGVGVGNYKPIYGLLNMDGRISLGLSTCAFVILAQTGISIIIWPVIRVIKNKYTFCQYSFLIMLLLLFLFTNIPYKLINIVLIYSVLYYPVKSQKSPGVIEYSNN